MSYGGPGVTTRHTTDGPLSTEVARLCHGLWPLVGGATATGLRQVLDRLSAPLQVAVAGRIKSGKSTLVNALIGRRVAPTDVGECTRLVTRFQYGTVDRVEVVLRDGQRQSVPFTPEGAIPADLGVDFARVSHLEAYLTSAALRELTVIDTPGLGSLDASSVARTEEVLGTGESADTDESGAGRAERLDPVSRSALAGAEAVLYVVTQSVRADDRAALSSFTAATGSRDAGPANAVAVLNKADTVQPDSVRGADGDQWAAARELAARQFALLKPRVADVLPVIGLLAETAETGGFTAGDAEALRRLAELDETTRETMLVSADLFTSLDCGVGPSTRARLLELLDLHGIRGVLRSIDNDPEITAGALRRSIREASGLSTMVTRLESVFRDRADGIKAAAALASISALGRDSGDPHERARVHDAMEELLAKPEAHQLRLLEALTLVSSGAVTLPSDLLDEVLRIGGSGTAAERLGMPDGAHAELVDHALTRANWWRSFASLGSTPAQSRVAHVVHRAYFLLWQQLGGE